ncbi:MAG: hypothetical protein LBQ88_22030, partial [Treponema sp.]|nr:hypothetical protein [Treponema sp.]
LSRRIDNIDTLRHELLAWESDRNFSAAKINWHFSTGDAREKLISLYPKFEIQEQRAGFNYTNCQRYNTLVYRQIRYQVLNTQPVLHRRFYVRGEIPGVLCPAARTGLFQALMFNTTFPYLDFLPGLFLYGPFNSTQIRAAFPAICALVD